MATLPGAEGAVLEATKDVMRASMVEQGAEEAKNDQPPSPPKSGGMKRTLTKTHGLTLTNDEEERRKKHDSGEAPGAGWALATATGSFCSRWRRAPAQLHALRMR